MKIFLSQNRPLRLITLCVLYAAQGIPDGFVRIALKNHLIGLGTSVAAVGSIVAMVSWPWSLKFLWGPVIDRFTYPAMGRRRPWILAAQLLMGITLALMALVPDLGQDLRLLAAMVLAVNIFASLQDVSVDALAVDLLPEKERGLANGFMYGSSYAGNAIGGLVLGMCILHYGFSTAVGLQVAMLMMIAAFPFFLRERPGEILLPSRSGAAKYATSRAPATASSLRELFGLLFRAFRLRSSILAGVLAFLSLVAVNSHLVYWPTFVQQDLGWTQQQWLALEGGWAVWFGLGGSIIGGLIASVIGAKRAVILSLAGFVVCWLVYANSEAAWTSHDFVFWMFLVESALAGLLQVSMFALFMGVCWPPVAATQFTTYMALMNLSNGFGALLAGPIVANFAIGDSHYALAVLQFALIGVVVAIDPYQVRRVLGEGVQGTEEPLISQPVLVE